MTQGTIKTQTYPKPPADLSDATEITGTLPVANGGTASTDAQTAINTLMGSVEGDVGKVPAVDSDGNVILTGGLPGTPVVAKTIDANNIVRFTVTQDTQNQTNEEYRFELYDPTGSTVEHTRTLTSLYTGSDRLRDKWVEFSTAEQTAAGYTPGPTETFWIDVVQVGDDGNSDSNKKEL